MADSQHQLSRIRPPRVQITYDVETGGAIEVIELPLVVGIMGDYSRKRDPDNPLPPLKERQFVEIDRDNFDDILKSMVPRASVNVKTLEADGSFGDDSTATLTFEQLDDFHPNRLLKNPDTGDLYLISLERTDLVDLQAKLDGNDELKTALEQTVYPPTDTSVVVPSNDDIIAMMTHNSDDQAEKDRAQVLIDVAKRFGDAALYVSSAVFDETNSDGSNNTDTFNLTASIILQLEKIDQSLSVCLNTILHTPEFQKLEASWRGLNYLVMKTETGTMLKLRVLNASFAELQNDLAKAVEFDQSQLFKNIYEAEYGMFGGNPYSVLIGDFEFGRKSTDVDFLENMSQVAGAAHAPFIAAASPRLFDWESFTELPNPRDLAKLFESTELIKWRSFRDSEASRYVSLTLPRFLLRLPYDGVNTPLPVEAFDYQEDIYKDGVYEKGCWVMDEKGEWVYSKEDSTGTACPRGEVIYKKEVDDSGAPIDDKIIFKKAPGDDGPLIGNTDHNKYLWGNPAYALAERITHAFALYKWCAAIRGYEGGGLVADLPLHNFYVDDGQLVAKIPTEVAVTDRRENELNNLGFITLCYRKATNEAVFFGGHSTQKPKVYDTDDATANAELSAMLTYMLAASRFAHYIKVLMRDKVGSFMTKENVSDYLNRWIAQYTMGRDDAGQSLKAAYPLRESRIDVADVPGKPGYYTAVVFLRPHFQLEGLTASIRLVAELPPPAGG